MHEIFKILGQEHRYKIVAYLAKNGSSCVCDLEELLGMKQANLSKHLKVMRDGGVLQTESVGKNVHYFISESFKNTFGDVLDVITAREDMTKIVASCEVR